MPSSDNYESVVGKANAEVASFGGRDKSLIARFHHALHTTPALVPLIVLLAAIAIFGVALGSKFFSPFALTLILQQVQIVGIVAAAQSLVILTAGIDLSVGAIAVISSVVMGQFTFRYGIPPAIAVACGLAFGTAIGALNGWLIARMKLPPFIVTLGMWQIVLAANFLYSQNETIRSQDIAEQAPLLQFMGNKFNIGGAVFTFGVVFMVLLVLVLAYVLKHTAWGRHVYAVGDDAEAAELSGVNVFADADFRLRSCWSDLRLCRLGFDRTHRIGFADLGTVAQHRKHHRCCDRWHFIVRGARVDPWHVLWCLDCRGVHARPASGRS